MTFPGIFGAIAKAHMDRYETNLDHLLKVGIKNHQNGALNPKAQFNESIHDLLERRKARALQRGQPVPEWADEMDFLNDPQANPWIAWPLRLYDCAPITDGAACVLLVPSELAFSFTDKPVQIAGTGQATGRPLHDAEDLTSLPAAKVASSRAYEMAGVTAQDVQVAEVHDCFTIAEIVATEDLGFFQPGEGPRALDEGRTARDGDKPINTSGGLKAKGHPVGALGVAQVIEIFHQLRGEAGSRQLNNPNLEVGADPQRRRHRRDLRRQHSAPELILRPISTDGRVFSPHPNLPPSRGKGLIFSPLIMDSWGGGESMEDNG